MKLIEAIGLKMFASVDERQQEFVSQNKEFFVNLLAASKSCKQMFELAVKRDWFLIRGSNEQKLSFYRAPSKTKRKPVDTTPEVDEYIEQYRKKYFPKVASRQKAVFMFLTTGRRNFDNQYIFQYGGNSLIIFPKNGSKFFQSKYIVDVYTSHLMSSIEGWIEDEAEGKNKEYPEREDRIKAELKDYFGEDGRTDISRMSEDNEVVVEHKGYFAFNKDMWMDYCKLGKINPNQLSSKEQIDKIKTYLGK